MLRIARPGSMDVLQRVIYIAHKLKHAIYIQPVTNPARLCFPLHSPELGPKYDMFLHVASGLDENMADIMFVNGQQYVWIGE